jgi:hypothetical protein
MGTISIFSLDFSGTRFACSRSFVGGYGLRAGDHTLSLTPAGADALAQGGRLIRMRAQIAARSGKEMRSGATFRRDMRSVDGRVVGIEIGISDQGDSVYIEIAGTRLTLADQQAQLLLAVLDRLGEDVTTIQRASEPPGLDLTVAQSMRGLYPWEVGEW